MNRKFSYITLILSLFLILSGCGKSDNDVTVVGRYSKPVDLTDYARAEASKYLSDAWMSDKIDINEYIENVTVSVNVTLYSNDTYTEELDEQSYEEAKKKVNEGLKNALTDLILLRLEAKAVPLNSRDEVNALMVEKTGMTMDEYLATYGPRLIKDKEELNAMIGGSGSYALPKEK